MKVVLAGGAGSLGRRLADFFAERGDDVVILTRSGRADVGHAQVEWDGRTVGPWANELAGATIVNLAGALVDRRPTPKNIELLTRSRVEPTRALVEASRQLHQPPRLWLQMSTLAIHSEGGDQIIDESTRVADGLPQMTGVARAWEAAADGAVADRMVVLRTGIVLDRHSPALDRLAGLARWGLGGRVGRGQQWISWIHIDDFLAALAHIVDHPELVGLVHVTGPNPARNVEMMAAFRSAVGRRFGPPTPAPLVHVGAWFLRTDPALALTGRRCVPARLLETGLRFEHDDITKAVADLVAFDGPAESD